MERSTKILAIETTDSTGSVALCENGTITLFRTLVPEMRSARSLAPTIRDVLNEAQWKAAELDVVAVAIGPGSFTGLRVGVATAKMLAWSVGAKIVGIDALDALACELKNSPLFSERANVLLSLGIDAQRGDAAVRDYHIDLSSSSPSFESAVSRVSERFQVIPTGRWLDVAERAATSRAAFGEERVAGSEIFFAGPALERVRDLDERRATLRVVEREYWRPSAKGVAQLARERAQLEKFDDVWSIAPLYSRKAAAEERALEKARLEAERKA